MVVSPFFAVFSKVDYDSIIYDISGRVYQENSPDGSFTRFIYDRLLTCTHNDLGQLNYHTKNVVGDLVHVKDTLGHETTYEYNSFNNLTRVVDDQWLSNLTIGGITALVKLVGFPPLTLFQLPLIV